MDLEILDENIYYYKNIIENPYQLIEYIEKTDSIMSSTTSITKWSPWGPNYIGEGIPVVEGEFDRFGAQKRINIPVKTDDENLNNACEYIYKSLRSEKFFEAGNYYAKQHGGVVTDFFPSILSRYAVGNGMSDHIDSIGDPEGGVLGISCIIYLTDNYDGGEIVFPNHNISLKPEAGSAMMFSSYEPYIHRVNPISSGIKYISPSSFGMHKK